jgi:heme/copper-type cytochrome/quinol oxidase subunit 2
MHYFVKKFPIYLFIIVIKVKNIISRDNPVLWQTYFNDLASITMEGILIFNKHLLFLITVIVLFVGWLLFSTLYYFTEFNNKFQTKFVHSKELEIVWTSVPAIILLLLSTPFFTLLCAMDDL